MSAPRPSRSATGLIVSVTAGRGTRAASGLAAFLVKAAPRRADGAVDIALVSDRRMRAINERFRGVRAPTDVLSFPAGPTAAAWNSRAKAATKSLPVRHLGDIAIAVGVARRQAAAQRHSLGAELRILALHGLLHLLGYDHERDRGEMRRLEDRLRRRAGLTEGLIARARVRRRP
jgi:probable rRNA maturation factor